MDICSSEFVFVFYFFNFGFGGNVSTSLVGATSRQSFTFDLLTVERIFAFEKVRQPDGIFLGFPLFLDLVGNLADLRQDAIAGFKTSALTADLDGEVGKSLF